MMLREKFKDIIEDAITYDQQYDSFEQIADEFATGFAFYLSDNYTSRTLDTWDDAVGIRFTTKQVLEIYKKEKGL